MRHRKAVSNRVVSDTVRKHTTPTRFTGFVQKVVIQYTVEGAGKFDIWFVNNLGLPFFSGFTFYFILLAALIYAGFRLFNAPKLKFSNITIWLSAFLLLLAFPFIGSAPGFLALQRLGERLHLVDDSTGITL